MGPLNVTTGAYGLTKMFRNSKRDQCREPRDGLGRVGQGGAKRRAEGTSPSNVRAPAEFCEGPAALPRGRSLE